MIILSFLINAALFLVVGFVAGHLHGYTSGLKYGGKIWHSSYESVLKLLVECSNKNQVKTEVDNLNKAYGTKITPETGS